MKIPFVGGAGPARSPDADNQRLVNAYVEVDEGNPRAPAALYGMPGLVLAQATGPGPIRGSIQSGKWTYFVSGGSIWRRGPATGAWVKLTGSLQTLWGQIVMATNGREVMIADGTSLQYVVNPQATAQETQGAQVFQTPYDPDLPTIVQGVAYLNGYWLAWGDHGSESDDDQKFWYREDTTPVGDWNGLDFASVAASPDRLLAGLADHGQMWFVGTDSAEIFTNVADPDMPFQRSGSSFMEMGTVARASLAKFDNAVVWLARDANGQGMFIRSQGGNPVRFSTHKVETALRRMPRIDDAIAWTFQMDGHSFYVCTFPTADATWVFDAASGAWAEWLWRDTAGVLHAHRAITHTLTDDGKHLVGDRADGRIYELRMDAYTDDGDLIPFIRRTPTVYDEGAKLTMEELRIDMETGVASTQAADPKVMLRCYRDGIHPGPWKEKSIGGNGAKRRQVAFHALGQGHAWDFEIQILDPVRRAVFGGYARVRKSRGGS